MRRLNIPVYDWRKLWNIRCLAFSISVKDDAGMRYRELSLL